jgi:FlaA1/EpsC-like NDP-sugar epimerase
MANAPREIVRDHRHAEQNTSNTKSAQPPNGADRFIRLRNRHFAESDILLLTLACAVAFTLRFEGFAWLSTHARVAAVYVVVTVPARILAFYAFGLYQRVWQHASIAETERILIAGVVGGIISAFLGIVVLPWLGLVSVRLPYSVAAIDLFATVATAALPRLSLRILWWRNHHRRNGHGKRVLIAGAGEAGVMTAREVLSRPDLGLTPIGFVDDDQRKVGRKLLDIPVLGTLGELPDLLRQYAVSEVIIAMPSAPGDVVRQLVRAAHDAGIQARTIPGLYEILSGRVGVSHIREVGIQDLLRREPIETTLDQVRARTTGQVVLVTGAGGSIGSELCRQLAQLDPAQLILLGHGENSIFEIHQELTARFPKLRMAPVIADTRDRARLDSILSEFDPETVFHAAAHKHVPLMETNVIEALTNNVVGTQNLVSSAVARGVKHFVLISTDKAVRPTSVMGASKRIAEQIVQLAAAKAERPFVAVRFGNVLGSRGSVIPTFVRQIRAGGPVTVTHPDMCRYFMTVPEAVQLVLQAFSLGCRGEVFMLDMGDPVRIVDLARDLIELSGLQVDRDIEIRFTGLRPGEKLFEEMFFSAEEVLRTEHPKVLRARHATLANDVDRHLTALLFAIRQNAPDDLLRPLIKALVPDFKTGVDETTLGEPTTIPPATPSRPAPVGISWRTTDQPGAPASW